MPAKIRRDIPNAQRPIRLARIRVRRDRSQPLTVQTIEPAMLVEQNIQRQIMNVIQHQQKIAMRQRRFGLKTQRLKKMPRRLVEAPEPPAHAAEQFMGLEAIGL